MANVMSKAAAGMAAAGHAMKRGVSNTKQEGKVVDLQKQARKLTFEVGVLTVLHMDDGRDVSAPVGERYEAILALRDQITEAKAAEQHVTTVCPHCGEKTVAGMKYCGHCGKEL